MLVYPQIDPVAVQIGPLAVHWYGLMYLFGFLLGWGLLVMRARDSWRGFTREQVSDVVFYIAMGVIIGGRLGYMLFYDFSEMIHNPLSILMVWHGGMSFHGGALGVTFALWLWGRRNHKTLGEVGDFIIPVVPLGLMLGRIGNFINGELSGRVTDVPWGMIFPQAGDLPRHPSQLYEAFFEGFVLFVILWIFSKKPRPFWAVSGLFLMLYAAFRFGIEFFREPDVQIGYLMGGFTEGQLLSVPMFLIGMIMTCYAYRRNLKLCGNI